MYNGRLKHGGIYVNIQKELVREVYDIKGDTHYWISYHLRDGRPTGDSMGCGSSVLRQWADREATQEEVERLKRGVTYQRNSDADAQIAKALTAATDEQLLAEVRRRGLVP